MRKEKVRYLCVEKKDKWFRARSHPHRHQRLTSRLIRRLRSELGLSQPQLGSWIGVSGITVHRWERRDGAQPRRYYWKRIRELWKLVRALRTEKFWEDRTSPPEFWR